MSIRGASACAAVVAVLCVGRVAVYAQGFATVQGFVLDDEGKGIDAASVMAYRLLPGTSQRVAMVSTESDGHYVLQLPDGQFLISVEAEGYSKSFPRKVSAPSNAPLNFELSPLQASAPSDAPRPRLEASSVLRYAVGLVTLSVVGWMIFGTRAGTMLGFAWAYVLTRIVPSPTRIFVSYRRAESVDVTGRIYDRLWEHFGKKHVFKDVDSIPPGIDFRAHIQKELQGCQIAVVVIGDRWLTEQGQSGMRRLDEPNDWVRLELEAVLERGIPVIPVLVQGVSIPKEHELPASIASISYRAAVVVRPDPDFHRDVDRLIAGIQGHLQSEQE